MGGREIHRPTSLAVYKEKQSPADPKEPPLQAVGHRLLLYQQSSLWIPEQGKVLHLRIVFQNCKSLFSLKAISELLCNTEGEKNPFLFLKRRLSHHLQPRIKLQRQLHKEKDFCKEINQSFVKCGFSTSENQAISQVHEDMRSLFKPPSNCFTQISEICDLNALKELRFQY